MPDSEDQVQNQEGNESASAQEDSQASVSETDNQDTSGKEQSTKNESTEEKELFEIPGGRKVDAQTLAKEWNEKFYPEFTKRSQALAEIRRQQEERKTRAEGDARDSIAENKVLKQARPEVKEAIVQLVKPVIEESLQRRDQVEAEKRKDKEFKQELLALEKEFPGGDGKPKFDRAEVISYMKKPGNRDFDPRSVFMNKLYKDDFVDLAVKEALKKQKGGRKSERTGGSGKKKPDKKTPKTFDEAGSSFLSRLRQS